MPAQWGAMSGASRKRVLVTGAGSGTGRACAIALWRTGHDVALLGRTASRLADTAAFAAPSGGRARILKADLGDRRALDAALDELVRGWPWLDALVLNAGTHAPTPLEGPGLQDFDRLVEVNLAAPLRTLRRLVPHMRDGGRIVAVSSVLGRFGVPGYHGYCASKAGLLGLVRAMALELAPRRITVNAVVPGWVDTPMAAKGIAEQAPGMGLSPEQAREAFLSQVPLGRMASPSEVAHTVLHLLGPRAEIVTGQAWDVDGGVTA